MNRYAQLKEELDMKVFEETSGLAEFPEVLRSCAWGMK
jgi:hypothetical protein